MTLAETDTRGIVRNLVGVAFCFCGAAEPGEGRTPLVAFAPVIALEVSSAGPPGTHGGVPGAIRNLVPALICGDPQTRYALCVRLSRWRKGHGLRIERPNACVRVLQDPLNALALRGARLLHSMGIFTPRTPRIPKLVTVHDLNAVRNTQWVRESWHARRSDRIRQAVTRASHVVTYSRFTAQEVSEELGIPRERVHPIPLGVDCGRFRPLEPEVLQAVRKEHGDYVLAIGLFTPRKNFPALVEAMAALPELDLVLVGRRSDGSEALELAIDRTRMRSRVRVLSDLHPDALVRLIGGARAFAVPSLYEGFGLTVLEALACGVPVVCSNAASLPEVAGDAALLVDARSSEALAEALGRVVRDAELAEALRLRGLARARAFSWESSAQKLRALYRSVAGC
jgi:alpha-1,3-rhamnosyl/mannosyltransferase